jgi:hypothetical protein
VTAWGETKTAVEWENDPRCSVDRDIINRRIASGWNPEEAISQLRLKKGHLPDGSCRFKNPPKLTITAFGETKSPPQWAEDPRCVVSLYSIYRRLKHGWEPEMMLTTPADPRKRRPGKELRSFPAKLIRAWGEEKTMREWLMDPRCTATETAIPQRMRRGWSAEEAMTLPSEKGHRLLAVAAPPPAPPVSAFGCTKSAVEWIQDPRCEVNLKTLYGRLRMDWDPERAITTPPTPPRA